MKASLLLILFLLAPHAMACVPVPPPEPQELLKDARYVAVGYVVGERYPDFEAYVGSGGDLAEYNNYDTRLVKVLFTQSIQGPLPSPSEIQAPCDWPFMPKVKDRVAVAAYQGQYYFLLPKYEQELRALVVRAHGR